MADYFIRLKGKVWGPFALDQLKTMQGQGRLSAFHEVSQDRVIWTPVSASPELAPPQIELLEVPPPLPLTPANQNQEPNEYAFGTTPRRRERSDDRYDDDDERYDRPRRGNSAVNRGNGTMALVLGLVSIFVFPILGVVAIIIANQALREDPNDGNAKAGLVLGWISTACVILGILFFVIFFMIIASSARHF